MVKRDLGSQASVLQTREVRGGGLLRWLSTERMVEVTASADISVPSRLPKRVHPAEPGPTPRRHATIAATPLRYRTFAPISAAKIATGLDLLDHINQLSAKTGHHDYRDGDTITPDRSETLFRLFAELIEADVSEELARQCVDRLRRESFDDPTLDASRMKDRLATMIEQELPIAGPIHLTEGRRHLVALVGPTGVGKTTTIAKLAANFRLRDKRRVGLITVDTYRIAAVEQLRTYADIIDLPMEIVATPSEMHQAVARMADLELVLMDTAGRSPCDEVQMQELKSMLAEAAPDEVHLVLSSVASAKSLAKTAEQLSGVGTTALVLTKLDEAASLGSLLGLVRSCRLPLSYLTHGQNVPDDIAPADGARLARMILGMETIRGKRAS